MIPSGRSHIAAVVLARNGAEFTVDCVASLLATGWPRLRVLVVDNASSDGTAELLTKRFPDVVVLRSEVNLGFAAGNNLGLSRAIAEGCDQLLVLNNDTVVAPNAIEALVAAARAHPDAGAIAPLITYEDPPDLIWFGGADYDPRRGYPGRVRHYRRSLDDTRPAPGVTDRFTGAAVLLARAVVEQVGGFDERLFFLYEDVDLSLRIRATGRCIWFAPEAVVVHRVAMTQGGEHSPLSYYYGVRNQLAVAARHAPLGGISNCRRTSAAVAVHLARVRHAPDRQAALRAVLDGVRDHRRGYLGPRDP